MCAALTIASGSFFLGQQRIMPAYMRGISFALRSSDRAVAVDGLLADPRSTHAVVRESEIPAWQDRPSFLLVKTNEHVTDCSVLRWPWKEFHVFYVSSSGA